MNEQTFLSNSYSASFSDAHLAFIDLEVRDVDRAIFSQ